MSNSSTKTQQVYSPTHGRVITISGSGSTATIVSPSSTSTSSSTTTSSTSKTSTSTTTTTQAKTGGSGGSSSSSSSVVKPTEAKTQPSKQEPPKPEPPPPKVIQVNSDSLPGYSSSNPYSTGYITRGNITYVMGAGGQLEGLEIRGNKKVHVYKTVDTEKNILRLESGYPNWQKQATEVSATKTEPVLAAAPSASSTQTPQSESALLNIDGGLFMDIDKAYELMKKGQIVVNEGSTTFKKGDKKDSWIVESYTPTITIIEDSVFRNLYNRGGSSSSSSSSTSKSSTQNSEYTNLEGYEQLGGIYYKQEGNVGYYFADIDKVVSSNFTDVLNSNLSSEDWSNRVSSWIYKEYKEALTKHDTYTSPTMSALIYSEVQAKAGYTREQVQNMERLLSWNQIGGLQGIQVYNGLYYFAGSESQTKQLKEILGKLNVPLPHIYESKEEAMRASGLTPSELTHAVIREGLEKDYIKASAKIDLTLEKLTGDTYYLGRPSTLPLYDESGNIKGGLALEKETLTYVGTGGDKYSYNPLSGELTMISLPNLINVQTDRGEISLVKKGETTFVNVENNILFEAIKTSTGFTFVQKMSERKQEVKNYFDSLDEFFKHQKDSTAIEGAIFSATEPRLEKVLFKEGHLTLPVIIGGKTEWKPFVVKPTEKGEISLFNQPLQVVSEYSPPKKTLGSYEYYGEYASTITPSSDVAMLIPPVYSVKAMWDITTSGKIGEPLLKPRDVGKAFQAIDDTLYQSGISIGQTIGKYYYYSTSLGAYSLYTGKADNSEVYSGMFGFITSSTERVISSPARLVGYSLVLPSFIQAKTTSFVADVFVPKMYDTPHPSFKNQFVVKPTSVEVEKLGIGEESEYKAYFSTAITIGEYHFGTKSLPLLISRSASSVGVGTTPVSEKMLHGLEYLSQAKRPTAKGLEAAYRFAEHKGLDFFKFGKTFAIEGFKSYGIPTITIVGIEGFSESLAHSKYPFNLDEINKYPQPIRTAIIPFELGKTIVLADYSYLASAFTDIEKYKKAGQLVIASAPFATPTIVHTERILGSYKTSPLIRIGTNALGYGIVGTEYTFLYKAYEGKAATPFEYGFAFALGSVIGGGLKAYEEGFQAGLIKVPAFSKQSYYVLKPKKISSVFPQEGGEIETLEAIRKYYTVKKVSEYSFGFKTGYAYGGYHPIYTITTEPSAIIKGAKLPFSVYKGEFSWFKGKGIYIPTEETAYAIRLGKLENMYFAEKYSEYTSKYLSKLHPKVSEYDNFITSTYYKLSTLSGPEHEFASGIRFSVDKGIYKVTKPPSSIKLDKQLFVKEILESQSANIKPSVKLKEVIKEVEAIKGKPITQKEILRYLELHKYDFNIMGSTAHASYRGPASTGRGMHDIDIYSIFEEGRAKASSLASRLSRTVPKSEFQSFTAEDDVLYGLTKGEKIKIIEFKSAYSIENIAGLTNLKYELPTYPAIKGPEGYYYQRLPELFFRKVEAVSQLTLFGLGTAPHRAKDWGDLGFIQYNIGESISSKAKGIQLEKTPEYYQGKLIKEHAITYLRSLGSSYFKQYKFNTDTILPELNVKPVVKPTKSEVNVEYKSAIVQSYTTQPSRVQSIKYEISYPSKAPFETSISLIPSSSMFKYSRLSSSPYIPKYTSISLSPSQKYSYSPSPTSSVSTSYIFSGISSPYISYSPRYSYSYSSYTSRYEPPKSEVYILVKPDLGLPMPFRKPQQPSLFGRFNPLKKPSITYTTGSKIITPSVLKNTSLDIRAIKDALISKESFKKPKLTSKIKIKGDII